jgi:hypothetical protein|tara:strand:+ start:115 stop:534 length:420 start_codon:yes stop_codon:yes gene_type:complete
MKAILINPKLQTIKEINYSGDYKDIYKLTECSTFTCVYPFHLNEDVIYLDDEGLLKESNYCFTFRCDNGHNPPLMGNALIVGTDEQGDSQDIESSIEMIKERVKFLGHQEIDLGNEIKLSPLPTIFTDEYIARAVKNHD